jgi:Resolvase, N terminal domain
VLVAKMDRLSRSVVDGAGLMERAARQGWALHFADLDIDTPAGEMAANIIISGSQYERRLISQRTRDALAAKRARGERLGAAPALPLEVTRRIITERRQRRTFQAIAQGLMADGIPTAPGQDPLVSGHHPGRRDQRQRGGTRVAAAVPLLQGSPQLVRLKKFRTHAERRLRRRTRSAKSASCSAAT